MNKPLFIMLVGIAGSGKSTYAKTRSENEDNCIVLSSDGIREELYGDESIQRNHNKVFQLMEARARAAAKNGQSVIYDATNLNARRRAHMVRIMAELGCKCECVICLSTFEVCCERQLMRERQVPIDVIMRQYTSFEVPTEMEGWDNIILYHSPNGGTEDLVGAFKRSDVPHDSHYHTLTIMGHMERAAEILERRFDLEAFTKEERDILKRAVLFHDIGKPFTKSFLDNKGNISREAHYYGHENVSAWMILCAENPIFSEGETLKCAQLVGLHMRMYNEVWYDRLFEFYANTDSNFWQALQYLHYCDEAAH